MNIDVINRTFRNYSGMVCGCIMEQSVVFENNIEELPN